MEVDITKLSLQRVQEFDNTLASVHNNLSQDNPQTEKGFEVVNEEPTQHGVKNIQTEEEKQFTVVGGNPKPVIQDYSSNTSLSQKEILSTKRKNPSKALRRLQNLRKLSTDTKSSNSYSASLADTSEGVVNLLIQLLKANIFEVELLTTIE